MEQMDSFFLKLHYDRSLSEKDKLKRIRDIIDWEKFRPIIGELYENKSSKGGRPNIDEIVMVKGIILQTLFGLSDESLEYNLNDRISFRVFIGLDQDIPDYSTFWRFKERIADTKADQAIHEEFMRQIEEKGYSVKKGVIQDATIIHSDIGKSRQSKERKEKKRGKRPKLSEKQLSHIDRDSSFTKKGNKTYHGYKNHIKTDIDNNFIRAFATTTASVHDSQIDLVTEDDNLVCRDKGFFGVPLRCKKVRDYTMKRATRGHPLTEEDKWRNKIISRVRIAVEKPFAVFKRHFRRDRTRVTRLKRVHVQQFCNCLTYNMLNLAYLEREKAKRELSRKS